MAFTHEVYTKHDMLGNQTYESSTAVLEFLDMFSINKYGRNFKPGIPLSKDFRNEGIQMAAMRPISETCQTVRMKGSRTSNVWLPSVPISVT